MGIGPSLLPLLTPRLYLRTLRADDADALHRLLDDPRIAATTLSIPYPYPAGAAERWIVTQANAIAAGQELTFAITLRRGVAAGMLIGTVSLMNIRLAHGLGTLGYWITPQHWGRGYATEAAQALINHAAAEHGISKVIAHCFTDNAASLRVLEKLGMASEGLMRSHVRKDDAYVDVYQYAWCAPERCRPQTRRS